MIEIRINDFLHLDKRGIGTQVVNSWCHPGVTSTPPSGSNHKLDGVMMPALETARTDFLADAVVDVRCSAAQRHLQSRPDDPRSRQRIGKVTSGSHWPLAAG